MKKYLLSVLFLVFLQSGNLFAITGEIIIRTINGTAPKLRVTINANSYIWKWDAANQKVIPETRSYPITYNNGSFSYKFDACNDINDGLDYIPWGLMDFAVSTLDANNNPVYTVHFTLDLRDQDWSVNEYKYPSHDTYIQRNLSANRWEIYCNGYTYTISEGSCYEIWSLWMDGATPNTINLKVPITLMNRTEGGITDFGYLIANGSEQVNSGQAGNFRFDTQNMVSHGTTEETSNGRKYSFKWDPYNVDKVLTQNIYSSALDFTIPENKNSKGITRRFHQVYSLTAKNDIEGTGISAGTLYFKDPTTTNTLEEKTSTFTKNEAFANLDESINGIPNQKYALQAQNIIQYGGTNYQWYSGDFNPNTKTDFIMTGQTVKTAYYKGSLRSNTQTAYSNSSQRKFIRTPDGSLHMVYESMGYVWYERSSDGGNTWIIMNGGKPLSTNPSKSPSIDYCGNTSEGTIGIVFQEKSPYLWECEGKIKYYPVFYTNGVYGNSILQDIDFLYDEVYDSFDASPVIAFGSTSPYFLVVWKGIDGLMTKYFNGNNSTAIEPLSSSAVLYSVSDQISEHPFLVSNKLGNTIFHLAWDENTSSSTGAIRYCKLSAGSSVNVVQGSYNSDLSSGSGFTKNSMPTMIPCPDNTVRMSWLGATTYGRKSAAFRGMFGDGSWNPRFWSFGSNVASQCINLGSDGYFVLFSDNISGSYRNQFTDSRTLSNIYTLNTTGKDLQLNNDAGGTSRTMYGMSFSSQSGLPYSFSRSNSIGSYYGLYKENSKETSGRMVVLKTDSLSEFYFSLQDISLDGRPVKFMDVSDSIKIQDINSLNKYMTTEPFTLTDNSKFLFNLNYGLTDSSQGVKALGKEGNISYSVDLLDEEGSVLQSFNKVSFSKDYVLKNKKSSFQVNMQGIGNKTVRMRLRTEVNFNAGCFLVDSHCVPDENGDLYKASETEKIDFSGEEVVKEYAISRNYPNPFNPSTVIDYQVPKTSKVTLKVFDMLGREVTTLVNEMKEMGRYSVKFDATELPSGTYIYEIRANDFVRSGKMMFLK